ncbi:hypothetical protein ACLKA6_006920 [Drosophila palustris]
MRAFMRQTRSGFKDLSVGFNKLNAQFLAVDAQFNSLKLLAESPKRKKSTPRDLQTTAISQFSTVEQFLTPTTPSAPQTMFATPIASMDVDIPIVDSVPTDTASSAPLSDSSAVVKKRTSRPKPNIAPPPVIVTAGSPGWRGVVRGAHQLALKAQMKGKRLHVTANGKWNSNGMPVNPDPDPDPDFVEGATVARWQLWHGGTRRRSLVKPLKSKEAET